MERAIVKAMSEQKKIFIIYMDRYGHFSKRMIHIMTYQEKSSLLIVLLDKKSVAFTKIIF